ncbi:hypothetical protein AHAS_Ahas20G0181600 [Arachis hypogaea]
MTTIEKKVIKFNKSGDSGYKKNYLNVVRKIISDKEVRFKIWKNDLLKMWENPEEVAVIDIRLKKMLFSFKDKKRRLQIFQNGPWNVRKNLDNLRLSMEGKLTFEVDHNFMEFWIQVLGIPLDHMNKETRVIIGGMLGVLAEDPKVDGVLRRSFLRIRVRINITEALPTDFLLERVKLPPLWVFFKYERLLDSNCFNCRIMMSRYFIRFLASFSYSFWHVILSFIIFS